MSNGRNALNDNDVIVVGDDNSDVDMGVGTVEDPISLSDDEAGRSTNKEYIKKKWNGDSANHEVTASSYPAIAKRAVAVPPNNHAYEEDEGDGQEGTKIFACRNATGLSSFEVADDNNVVIVLGSDTDPWTVMDEEQYEGARAVVFFQLVDNLFHLSHIWTGAKGAFQAREGAVGELPMWPRMKKDDKSFLEFINGGDEEGEEWMPILLKAFKIVGDTIDGLDVAQVARKPNGRWEQTAAKAIDIDQLFANREVMDENLTDHIYSLSSARALF